MKQREYNKDHGYMYYVCMRWVLCFQSNSYLSWSVFASASICVTTVHYTVRIKTDTLVIRVYMCYVSHTCHMA